MIVWIVSILVHTPVERTHSPTEHTHLPMKPSQIPQFPLFWQKIPTKSCINKSFFYIFTVENILLMDPKYSWPHKLQSRWRKRISRVFQFLWTYRHALIDLKISQNRKMISKISFIFFRVWACAWAQKIEKKHKKG